jgi:RNA polymerase sigma-70 factor (ECF subfamily)
VKSGPFLVGNRRPNGTVGDFLNRPPANTEMANRAVLDDLSLARLFRVSQQRVYRLALKIMRNTEDAEDVQQETLLKVHRKLGEFQGHSLFTTWISRIAINEALMCLRKRPKAVHVSLEAATRLAEGSLTTKELHAPVEGPEAAYSRKELRHLLARALRNLSAPNRIVFLLRAVKQLSTRETANELQISCCAVKARMRRARHELRKNLTAEPEHSIRLANS